MCVGSTQEPKKQGWGLNSSSPEVPPGHPGRVSKTSDSEPPVVRPGHWVVFGELSPWPGAPY